jgi:hypothetical protein
MMGRRYLTRAWQESCISGAPHSQKNKGNAMCNLQAYSKQITVLGHCQLLDSIELCCQRHVEISLNKN